MTEDGDGHFDFVLPFPISINVCFVSYYVCKSQTQVTKTVCNDCFRHATFSDV